MILRGSRHQCNSGTNLILGSLVKSIRRHIHTSNEPDTVLIPTILKSIDQKSKHNQFTIDGLKKSNNQSMEDILTVLQESVEDTTRNHNEFTISPILIKLSHFNYAMKHHNSQYLSTFANDFGSKIINIVLFRIFNKYGVYYDHPQYLQLERNNFIRNELIEKYTESITHNNTGMDARLNLSWQQSIVKSFEFDIKTCLNGLIDEFKSTIIPQVITSPLMETFNSFPLWNLPRMKILDIDEVNKRVCFRDEQYPTKGSILSLSWAKNEGMERDETNLLCYLEMEERVLWRLIELKQMANNLKVSEADKLMKLMKLYEIEGQYTFEVMMKRILLKIVDTKLDEDGQLKPEFQDPLLMLDKSESSISFFNANDIIPDNTNIKRVKKPKQQYWQSRGIGKSKPQKSQVIDKMDEINITKFDYGSIDDEYILNNFIENMTNLNKFKIIVAFKSKLYHRIQNEEYVTALSSCTNRYRSLTDEEIKLKLISYFDRFWRVISITDTYLSYSWIIEIFKHLQHNRLLINDEMVSLAINDYKSTIERQINLGERKINGRSGSGGDHDLSQPINTPIQDLFESMKQIKHDNKKIINNNQQSKYNSKTNHTEKNR
ncbi:hypothetical protein DFJ63DRAFT_337878 [Scheffersomyces coipomensis]|uniref:uncharacterized protein n=1 Tax=Scheffersomyces coipomensis TaxID=1788519 RepID=UPI00315D6C4B